MCALAGDATAMPQYGDGEFDVVYSNSVIEHLFTADNQAAMAREVRRVGRAYWVQTPNHWFPVEPHFHAVGWQYLPRPLRVRICCWRGTARRTTIKSREHAESLVNEVRLLGGREMRRLFPDGRVLREPLGGLTKSWVAVGGFPGTAEARL